MAQAIPDFKARQAFVDQLSAGVSASQDVSSKITRTLGFFDSIVMNRATQRTDLPFLVQAAHAGGPIVAQPPEAIRHETTIETLKPFVYLAILGAIALFFFGCLGIYAFSGNKEKIKFASDMMKTVVGFWIGIVTGWAGGR